MDESQKRVRQADAIKLTEIDMTPIWIAFIVGFVVVALFVIFRKKTSTRRDVLLMGMCEAGKSAVFMRVLYDNFPDTFTSITENVGTYSNGNKSAKLIDIPGHYRVRDKCFEKYKRNAKGIAFVVDSVTVQKEIRDVADALYTILTDAATVPCKISVCCNKQDSTTAKGVEVIKSALEKELNIVRDTRSRKLQSTSDDETVKPVYLGRSGKDFEWDHLQQNIQFYEISAKQGQVNDLKDWIDKVL